MTRIAARLAVLVLAVAGCGGGGGESEPEHPGVAAFPDVLEVAKAELPEGAPLLAVDVSESQIAFTRVQFGRVSTIRYDTDAVFIRTTPSPLRFHPSKVFPVEIVPTNAPARILAAIQEREGEEVEEFEVTLRQDRPAQPTWRARATVGGATKQYRAGLDGTLAG